MRKDPGHRRNRELTRHELDLWIHVTRDVTMRHGAIIPAPTEAKSADLPLSLEQKNPEISAVSASVRSSAAVASRAVKTPPLAPLEPKIRRRLARGQIDVDAALDLHGMRQDQAHSEVRRFLLGAHAMGARIVLIVTGKGAPSSAERDDFRRTGVLRQIVPHWLREPALRKFVIGFEEAAPSQGGYGALYVRIRRSDRPGQANNS